MCKECKDCWNYMVSEIGCYGSDKPCEHYTGEDKDKIFKSERKNMEYKVIFVCYLTSRRDVHKQFAYISKATENIEISFPDQCREMNFMNVDKNIKLPHFSIEFFATYEEARKTAEIYYRLQDIFEK